METQFSTSENEKKESPALADYQERIRNVVAEADFTQNESSLATFRDEETITKVKKIVATLGAVDEVILVGIGGSSLGTEAIHEALRTTTSPRLHVLDAVSDFKMKELISALAQTPQEKIAVCLISKSGGTTETLTNTSVLFAQLEKLYGSVPFERCVCIGNEGSAFMETTTSLGCHALAMQPVIGGRYSVFTSVGLLPLALLRYDIDALLDGLSKTLSPENESQAFEGALSLFQSLHEDIRSINFFAFDVRLERLGKWYRQLAAESLGKEKDVEGNPVAIGFIPTISTAVELHSIGQLYFSGFQDVFTDFVSVNKEVAEYAISNTCVVIPAHRGKSISSIAKAIEGGVLAAYQERELPFRKVVLSELSESELGLYMGMRMLETMYLAKLMQVNAFDQPNVELYKDKTKEILDAQS